MFGYSHLNILFTNVMATGFVQNLFHSVVIRETDEGDRKPVAPVESRYVYVGIDDTKGFYAYCRQIGAVDSVNEESVGSCNTKIYTLQASHRMVFYNGEEKRSHETITAQLLKAFMKSGIGIKLQKVYTIPEQILQLETPTGIFSFKEHSFYIAVDFLVILKLQADTCEIEITCEGIKNPICK